MLTVFNLILSTKYYNNIIACFLIYLLTYCSIPLFNKWTIYNPCILICSVSEPEAMEPPYFARAGAVIFVKNGSGSGLAKNAFFNGLFLINKLKNYGYLTNRHTSFYFYIALIKSKQNITYYLFYFLNSIMNKN